jgi:uncharacterized protein YndB with AHSA1/START domain
VTGLTTSQNKFTVTRIYPAPVARVFRAIADPDEKRKWFEGPGGSKAVSREMDFREGGRERVVGRLDDGTTITFDCVYHDIVDNERMICSYMIAVNGRRIAVSQTSIQLQPEGQGTKLTLIEYNEFLDGHDDAGAVEKGTEELFDVLGAYLKGA